MTPFDPIALVAMLVAFYPVVTPANFALARRERPDYFAGGVIFGSKGDKLRLPDGREFDCIYAAGGPVSARRWTASLIEPGAPGEVDPFPLEAGPLEPMDEDVIIFPGGEPAFEPTVVEALGTLDGSEGILDAAAAGVIDAADPAALEGSYAALVEPAAAAHAGIRAALDLDDPADVIDATNRHDREIDSARTDYVEPEPPDIGEPVVPDEPGKGGDDGGPPTA